MMKNSIANTTAVIRVMKLPEPPDQMAAAEAPAFRRGSPYQRLYLAAA